MQHIHDNGCVHRDIKCENILLTGESHRKVLLADFGFATTYRPSVKSLNDSVGSLHYSAPEVLLFSSYEGPELDVWSMGVVLYAWCSGRLPFGGTTNEEISTRIITSSYFMQSCFGDLLKDLLAAMLEVDPKQRITMRGIRNHPWLGATQLGRATDGEARTVPTALHDEIRRSSLPELRSKPTSRLGRALKAVFHRKK